jgi:Spy/CpxP family protein refolding chaperone
MNEDEFRQYAFTSLLDEMEAAEQALLDDHRAVVQLWFDMLTPEQKKQLGEWMDAREWLTCQALSAAACDWYRSQPDQVAIGEMICQMLEKK